MTIAVDLGRKANKQTNKHSFEFASFDFSLARRHIRFINIQNEEGKGNTVDSDQKPISALLT